MAFMGWQCNLFDGTPERQAMGSRIVNLGLLVYVVGVVWGLLRIDARPLARFVLALLWPLGPMAFVATLTILFVASLIAFPLFGAVVLTATGVLWWALT